jgi:hypothetical protein
MHRFDLPSSILTCWLPIQADTGFELAKHCQPIFMEFLENYNSDIPGAHEGRLKELSN